MDKHIGTRLCALGLVALVATACSKSESSADPAAPDSAAAAQLDGQTVSGVHPVRCGCAIDSVGHCGNYVEVSGTFLPLGGDLGLGHMEFCGRDGLSATVAGTVVDGTLVATSFALVE